MKTAVLFDLGDVLVRLRFERGLARLASFAGCEPLAIRDAAAVYLGERALACNRGELSPAAFLEGLCRSLGREVPLADAAEAWCDIFDPWPEMEALAAEVLDAGHPVWLLSNTDPLHFGRLRERIPVLGRFSGLHLSYEVGLTKPDPAYFEAFLRRSGLAPETCAFADDRPDNVAAARAVGIGAHLHDGDVAALRAFLRERGVSI